MDPEREAIIDFANAIEAACVNLRMRLDDIIKPPATTSTPKTNEIAVNEITFTALKYDSMKGDKLGDFEIAYKTANIPDKFDQAYNVLHASNATIKTRYHGKTYAYAYWIYGEGKIYRQKLKEKT